MKLIFENWRRHLNEELLNELSFEDVKKRFNSKKFLKALKRHEDLHEDLLNYAKFQLMSCIPKDITEKNKAGALNWLISLFIKDPRKVLTEIKRLFSLQIAGDLELFFQIKQQNLARFLNIKSLSRMESVSELRTVVDAAREPYKKHIEKKVYLDAEQGKLKILENDEYTVFIPTNKGAACELGKGTEWCTAAPGLDYYEQYHSEDDPLIIFKSKSDPKKDVQMHFGTEQFMDVNDDPIGENHAIRLISMLKDNIAYNAHLPDKVFDIVNQVEHISLGDGKEVIINFVGESKWYLNGKLHREDGPALLQPNGDAFWYLNGKRHREGGPALERQGLKMWYLNGKRHREDGPAVETSYGKKEWYLNDKRHREGGPAVEHSNGDKAWYLHGKRHREDGPAVETLDGRKEWYLNGKLHREDGPAVVSQGITGWYLHGKLHREDGPAVEMPHGNKKWYLDGFYLSKKQYEEEMKTRKGEKNETPT